MLDSPPGRRIHGKEEKLSLGIYPDVSLKVARRRRDEAKALIAEGDDPAKVKLDKSEAAKVAAANTFKTVGEECSRTTKWCPEEDSNLHVHTDTST